MMKISVVISAYLFSLVILTLPCHSEPFTSVILSEAKDLKNIQGEESKK